MRKKDVKKSQRDEFLLEKGKLLSLYSKYKNADDKWSKILLDLVFWAEQENKVSKVPLSVFSEVLSKKIISSRTSPTPKFKRVFSDKLPEENAVLMISDTHIGKVNKFYNPETGTTMETYNTDIFKQEMRTLISSIFDIVNLLKHTIKIPKLNIMFLGDILDNDRIFSGQESQIDMCVGEQLLTGVSVFTEMFNSLLTLFESISVYSVVGNHGRSTHKKIDESVKNSYEYLLWRVVKSSFEGNERIKFNIPDTWFGLAKIYDWKYFLHHGDSVYCYGTTPFYGLQRMGRSRRVEIPHNIDLCGHFHQRMEIPISQYTYTLVNGCWIMGDSYSWRKYGIVSKPEQYFFGVNYKRPRTWSFNVELDKK